MAMLPLAARVQELCDVVSMVKVEAERLADLNIPRYGFTRLNQYGEPIPIGGRTIHLDLTPRFH